VFFYFLAVLEFQGNFGETFWEKLRKQLTASCIYSNGK